MRSSERKTKTVRHADKTALRPATAVPVPPKATVVLAIKEIAAPASAVNAGRVAPVVLAGRAA